VLAALALLAVSCAEPVPPASLEEARSRRVLIVGVDGASWNVLDPLLDAGRLPALRRLVDGGVRATLNAERGRARSGPSWTTIASGKLSAKHGIVRNEGQVHVARFWDILGDAGMRSVVIGWLLTYPTRPMYGVLLTGPFGEKQSFPRELLAELESELGPYLPDTDLRGIDDRFVESAHESTRRQTRYAEHLLAAEDWSAAAVIFTAPDRLQHFYWKFREPGRFGLDPSDAGVRRRAGVIDDWWIEFDGLLERLLDGVDLERTTLLIVSDHGFEARPAVDGTCDNLEPDYLLREAGWLVHDAAHRVVEAETVAWEVPVVEGSGAAADGEGERRIRVGDPALLQAVRELFAEAEIRPGGERCFDDVRVVGDEVRLLARATPGFDPEDTVLLALPEGDVEVSAGTLLSRPKARSGRHRRGGILVAAGAGVRRGVALDPLDGAQITPTLLNVLGLPGARDMDGAPATRIFESGYLPRAPAAVESYDPLVSPDDPDEYDLEAVRERLRGLGYVQ
jgi:hypothetical protein